MKLSFYSRIPQINQGNGKKYQGNQTLGLVCINRFSYQIIKLFKNLYIKMLVIFSKVFKNKDSRLFLQDGCFQKMLNGSAPN